MGTAPEMPDRPVPTRHCRRRLRRRWSWTAWPVTLIVTLPLLAGSATAAATTADVTEAASVTATATNTWAPVATHHGRRHVPDTVFSFAVIPDTQREVQEPSDTRFRERTQWLVDHRRELGLRFVTHTGDVVAWDTEDHAQTALASDAMRPLETAGIPYSLSIGNHDTQATGEGGGARDPRHTAELQRDTSVFNSYFTATRYGAVRGAFEPGKVDNIYSTFDAGGVRWLVLNLELWPRVAAVDWAKQVVAAHPQYNVIVVTHSYLTAAGHISTRSDYGDTSPMYLFDHLINVYPNIKMVFSGHVGTARHRSRVGLHGNKIVAFLAQLESWTTNPVRLVQIDTAKGTIDSRFYAPRDGQTYPQYAVHEDQMTWVRPARR